MSQGEVFVSCSARINNGHVKLAMACPESDLCMAIDYDDKLWKLEDSGWERYTPDPIQLALKGQGAELTMIHRLTQA